MELKDYKDKIRKLLSLAQSDNDHEAKSALLKAKQLMAEHKIAEIDLVDAINQKVNRIHTGISHTCHTKPWLAILARVIADNYCCKDYISKYKGSQTKEVCFVGLEDDVELCNEIFKYAVDTIEVNTKKLLKGKSKYGARYKKIITDSYANGFIEGLKEAFTKQQDESDWGLVMVTPQEVIDNMSDMKHFRSVSHNYGQENSAYNKGSEDGKNFEPGTKVLANKSSNLLLA